jgi:hypothetical protein
MTVSQGGSMSGKSQTGLINKGFPLENVTSVMSVDKERN